MTQHTDPQGSPSTASTSRVSAIEKGWSVFDSLERPVGNVTDLEGGRLRVDGRPQSLGFFEVPLDEVRGAEDGEVHLSLAMEEFAGRQATGPSGTSVDSGETVVVRSAGRSGEADGSSFTASGTPVGLGSNTPVGDEPTGFQAWDESVERRSIWSRIGSWFFAVAGLAAATLGVYAWWQRRQQQRRPLARARRAFGAAGESLEPVVEAAVRERNRAWWLTPLAAVPVILYLRSSGSKSAVEQAAERSAVMGSLLRNGRWRERLPAIEDSWQQLQSTSQYIQPGRFTSQMLGKPAPLWLLGVPAALGTAWLASRLGRQSGRKTKRLSDIMTPAPVVVRPETTVLDAASLMKRLDVGSLPVCDGRKLKGLVTDRDLVVRAIADGRDPHSVSVRDVMTSSVIYAFSDDSVQKGTGLMREHRIRRLPIVDRDKNLVGIVSLGDVAVDSGDEQLSSATLEEVSEPGPS